MESTDTPHLSDEERSEVKEALLGTIKDLRASSGFSGTLSEKLAATSAAAIALSVLCDGCDPGAAAAAAVQIASSVRPTRPSRKRAR